MLAIFQGNNEIIIIEMKNGRIPAKIKNQFFKKGSRDTLNYDLYTAKDNFLIKSELHIKHVD